MTPDQAVCTHFDGKFGVARLKDDDHNLAPDEPVFVFRASDKHMASVLAYYAHACAESSEPSPGDHIERVWGRRHQVLIWQEQNADRVRTPGLRQENF